LAGFVETRLASDRAVRSSPPDGYWPDLGLVVEFQEEQHSEAVELFDRRQTVSGVDRGEQRHRYDERKRTAIYRTA